MALFNKSIKYEELQQVAENKVDQVYRKGEYIDRYSLMQYLYEYYAAKRGSVDFHDVMDLITRMYISGKLKPWINIHALNVIIASLRKFGSMENM